MRMRRYQDLKVWQRSMDLAAAAYQVTATYPDDERYGLVSQTRRAAVSIPCNIAEGQGRSQPGEFLNQLSVARGSLEEFETLAIHAHRLTLVNEKQLDLVLDSAGEISRMLTEMRKTVERDQRSANGKTARPRRSSPR